MKDNDSKIHNENQDMYGFYGLLKAEFSSQILVDVTEVCNLSCMHCPHSEFQKSSYYAGRTLDPILNEKMAEEVHEHGQGFTQHIKYSSNGEPLTHPEIYRMLEYTKKRSGVMVALTTNGTLLTEKSVEKLIAIGVDLIDISIDAYLPETYANIRVNGNLLSTRANVINLIEKARQKDSKTKVVVSFVEQPLNQLEIGDFEKYWNGKGADYVVIRRLHSCSGAKKELADTRRLGNANIIRRPCLYPWERIGLNAGGKLFFCPSDWEHGSDIADYRDTTIYDTWRGEFYNKLREAHLNNDYQNYAFCGQCPDWEATRWEHEGRRYASMIEEFKE